ncbi:MAG: hypothetical protein FD127_3662 [Acidimicrobiaceae bacterium]|nr:MAG: hypothetical protein FD127_3662 [Acidimicrobiaceae bacterium]
MRSEQVSYLRRVRPRFVGVVLGTICGVVLAFAGPARAADIAIDAPNESAVGQTVIVTATITDAGEPVADAIVVVSRVAQLGGVSGFAELDRGTTDEAGLVSFEFVQYAASGELERLRIEYEGPDGTETAEFDLIVLPGPQQYVTSSGVDVGFVNVAWLVVVIGLVWFFLILAASQLLIVSRARTGSKNVSRAVPYLVVGFVAFTAVGMFTVVLTQPMTHANLSPTEPFDRAPAAHVGEQLDYEGDGAHHAADVGGEVLYIQLGCASCHGIGGRGATIGGELNDSTMSDMEEVVDAVRGGPKGMPIYAEVVLTDAEIQRIIDYVIEANGD